MPFFGLRSDRRSIARESRKMAFGMESGPPVRPDRRRKEDLDIRCIAIRDRQTCPVHRLKTAIVSHLELASPYLLMKVLLSDTEPPRKPLQPGRSPLREIKEYRAGRQCLTSAGRHGCPKWFRAARALQRSAPARRTVSIKQPCHPSAQTDSVYDNGQRSLNRCAESPPEKIAAAEVGHGCMPSSLSKRLSCVR
jgi:hypothetical protein